MLNQFLLPENSPIAINQGAVDPYSFDFSNERGIISTTKIGSAAITTAQIQDASITSAKVGTLSFNQLSGGTATLGGTADGNGLMSVQNSSGSEVVRIDNTGIDVTGGNISVYDSSGSLTFDAAGVVSTSNFLNSNIAYGTTQTFTGTAYGTLANSSSTIVLNRTTNILFFIQAPIKLNESVGNTGNGVVFIEVNRVRENSGGIFVFSGNTINSTYGINYLKSLTAGTHVIQAVARMEYIAAGTPSITLADYTFTYIRLGN